MILAVRLAPILPAWAPLVATCERALRDMRGVAAVWDARFEMRDRMTAPVKPVPKTLCGGHARPAPHPWADLAAVCERACRTMRPPREDEVRNLGWWAAEWRRRAVARKLCRKARA